MRFDPRHHLPLTPPCFQVLVALADGEKHGYAIVKEVERRTEGKVALRTGTLYPILKRLLDDMLVAESSSRPGPALDDERRRYYRLTPRGRAVALAEADRLEEAVLQARAKLALQKA